MAKFWCGLLPTGTCHTDIGAQHQEKPAPLPAILGHEGSGVVEAIGPGVTGFVPGDHVVLSYASCGNCRSCLTGRAFICEQAYELNFAGHMADHTHRHYQNGQPISAFFGQSSLATYSVASVRNLVKVRKDVPLELLGPLGCGIQTGAGTVLNKLKPPVGSRLAVFGCGSVGLSAVMAARLAGCDQIIGVDVHDNWRQVRESR